MSKQQILAIGNLNFFKNTKPQVTFLKGKNQDGSLDKVQADFSGWEQAKGIDLKAINATSKAGKHYIRVAITLTSDNAATYYNGYLMTNPKKVDGDRRPDFTGTVDLTKEKDSPKLELAAWHHPAKDGKQEYYSMSFSEKASETPPAAESNSAPIGSDADVAAELPAGEPIEA